MEYLINDYYSGLVWVGGVRHGAYVRSVMGLHRIVRIRKIK